MCKEMCAFLNRNIQYNEHLFLQKINNNKATHHAHNTKHHKDAYFELCRLFHSQVQHYYLRDQAYHSLKAIIVSVSTKRYPSNNN